MHSSANVVQQSGGPAGFGEGETDNLPVEVQSPSLGVPADPSQVEQPDQLNIWCLQLEIFFEKFFQASDHLEMIKVAQKS